MAKATEDYKSLNTELDTVLSALQAPDLDIDQALELYKHGQKAIKKLEMYLKTAENTIRKLGQDSVSDE